MAIYEWLCTKEIADGLVSGDRAYDLRENKYPFRIGDEVFYQAMNNGMECDHKINGMKFRISSILASPYLAEGHVILGLRKIERIRRR